MQSGPNIDKPPMRMRKRNLGEPIQIVKRIDSAPGIFADTVGRGIAITYRSGRMVTEMTW